MRVLFFAHARGAYDLQVAFDADGGEVDERADERTPRESLAQNCETQPVSQRSVEVNVAEPGRVLGSQESALISSFVRLPTASR